MQTNLWLLIEFFMSEHLSSNRDFVHKEKEEREVDHAGFFSGQLGNFLPLFSLVYWPDFLCNLRVWQLLLLDPAHRAAGMPPTGRCCWFCF